MQDVRVEYTAFADRIIPYFRRRKMKFYLSLDKYMKMMDLQEKYNCTPGEVIDILIRKNL